MHLLRTLGELSLTPLDGGAPSGLSGSKALLIPAWLATRAGHTARRDQLAEFMWPGSDRSKALRALRQALFYLGQHAPDILRKDDETLTLEQARLRVDLWEFDAAIKAKEYGRALELYRGPFAAGVERKVEAEVEQWIEAENSRLAVAIEVAFAEQIRAALTRGDHEEAERLARRFAAANPLDDGRQQTLIRTLRAVGDRVGALRVFDSYRHVVEKELGDQPPEALLRSMDALRQELTSPLDDLAAAAAPGALAREPPAAPPETAGRPTVGHLTLAVFSLAILALFALAILLNRERPAPAGFLGALQGTLLATGEGAGGPVQLTLEVREGSVEIRQHDNSALAGLPAPGRDDLVAYTEQAPSGWNVAVREGRNPPRRITSMEGDELPLAWAPDGRHLLVAHRRLDPDGRRQQHTLFVYDLAGDSARRLSELRSEGLPSADWSPDGTQIAFTADQNGAPDIFVVDFDGRNLRNLTDHPAEDRDPVWAPDRSRIAFVSRRGEDANVFTIRPDGTDLREMTQLTEDEKSPVWLSASELIFLAGGDLPELWALDVATGRAYRIGPADGVLRLTGSRSRPNPWVDRVRIAPRLRVGSPGQHVALGVEATDAEGTAVPYTRLPLRWEIRDSSVASASPAGSLTVRAPGATVLVLSAGGWRADTLSLVSLPLETVPIEPVLQETWQAGLPADRWRAFGDPSPRVQPGRGAGDAAILLTRGDETFESGVIGVQPVDLSQGIAVEVEGRAPFTGKLHQVFGFALYAELPADSLLETGRAPSLVALRSMGPAGAEPGGTVIVLQGESVALPQLASPGAWHTYTLQIQREGLVELIVDGSLFWRSVTPLPRRLLGSAHLALGFQSFGTDVAHGAVRIYPGLRYRLPELQPSPEGRL